MSDTPEPIGTSNTALAAFLLYHGHKFQGLMPDKHDSQRRIFYFIKEETSEELIREFDFGEPMVNAKLYQSKLKQAQRFLHPKEPAK